MSNEIDTTTVTAETEVVTNLLGCWSIPQDIDEQILRKCPDGTSLVCKVCANWDNKKTKLARIISYYLFTFGHFNQISFL